jgi:hypothetical protein
MGPNLGGWMFFRFSKVVSVRNWNDKIDINFIRLRKRNFHRSVFDITNCILVDPGMRVNNITVMNLTKGRQDALKMFQCFESSNHFATIQVYICRVVIRLQVTVSSTWRNLSPARFYTQHGELDAVGSCMLLQPLRLLLRYGEAAHEKHTKT